MDYDDYQDDAENEEVPCPGCGRPVYEDAEQCPHCGEWIMPLAGRARVPTWVRLTAALVAVAFLLWIVRGLLHAVL